MVERVSPVPLPELQPDSLGGRLLRAISAEPGEWGVGTFTRRLQASERSVETKVAELRRRALVGRPAFRLAPSGVAEAIAERGAAAVVGHGGFTKNARAVAVELVDALARLKEANSLDLATEVGVARLTGTHHRLLTALNRYGIVSATTALWTTPKGDDLVATWAAARAAR